MGLHGHVSPQNSRNCPALSRRPGTGMSNPYQHHLNRYGKAFTERLFGVRRRAEIRQQAFDTLCSTLGIEPRLAPPRSPQTNGMVERLNGRYRGSAAKLACSIRRRAGDDAAPLCLALQPRACTISFGQQNFLARHETMVQTQICDFLTNNYAMSRDVTARSQR